MARPWRQREARAAPSLDTRVGGLQQRSRRRTGVGPGISPGAHPDPGEGTPGEASVRSWVRTPEGFPGEQGQEEHGPWEGERCAPELQHCGAGSRERRGKPKRQMEASPCRALLPRSGLYSGDVWSSKDCTCERDLGRSALQLLPERPPSRSDVENRWEECKICAQSESFTSEFSKYY